IPGKGVHDVVFVATEHDSVYAFDATSNAGANAEPLWHVSFIDPAANITTVPQADVFNCGQIVPEIGITGTPVIDLASGTLYVVAMTKEPFPNISGPAYAHRLHALDITTGAEKRSVLVQASVAGTGEHGSTVAFIPRNYKQRPGLLLLNGVVYTAWSSHCDASTYHGWLIGYDARTLRQVSVYNSTPNGGQGSFWASGAAPAADASNNIYVISGNGTFDADNGGADLGESFIKLSTGGGGLSVADYFAPFNQADLNSKDLDTGSSGALLLPDEAGSSDHPHLLVSAGKEGRIYLLDRDNMGRFQAGSDSQIVQSLPRAVGGLFGIPAYFHNQVYFSGSGDALKAFRLSGGLLSTSAVSQSAVKFGFPGTVPSISANGNSDGIVWVADPSAKLRAYDAADLTKELFSGSLGTYVKFSVPIIANGKVYAGTQDSLVVFGLTSLPPAMVAAVVNAASFQPDKIAPGSIISLFGTNLAQGTASALDVPLPKSLGGVSLSVKGVAAPLFYVSPTQINAQIPFEAAPGPTSLILSVAGTNSPTTTFIGTESTAPGLFQYGQNRAVVQNQDGSVNDMAHSAVPGTVITAYLTGQGTVDNPVATGSSAPDAPLSRPMALVASSIGGQGAQVEFAGLAPGFVGLLQVNLRVPVMPAGEFPLVITIGGVASNAAVITVGIR
ncbi:MAG: hypothetical protein M3Z23_05695, partial [Acidobacteriota bacterium]|nr:hypothetical protein [Acidobacteriota bacterium]